MHEVVLATGNSGKVKELNALLAPLIGVPQARLGVTSVEETGKSFVENAIIKARHASETTGKPALADDSGLVVDALAGKPGIYSSRYAGEAATDGENIKKLLHALKGQPDEKRSAYFYCALVLVRYPQDPTPLFAVGEFHGQISEEPSGSSGFGYDPIFYLPERGVTLAELEPSIKNTISHRAQALNQLKAQLGKDSFI